MIHKFPIAWKFKVSGNVGQSTYESEWVALNALTREIMWARDVSSFILGACPVPSTVHIDNRAYELCIGDLYVTDANKHFQLKYFLVVEMSIKNEILIVKITTTANVADMLTKSLGHPAFEKHQLFIGVL